MRKKILIVASPLVMLLLLVACTSNSVDDLREDINPCDTVTATFDGAVSTIIEMNCGTNRNSDPAVGCHEVGNGFRWEFTGYTQVKSLVDAGRIQARALSSTPTMPPSFATNPAGALSDCDKTILQNWIDAGAPEN